MPDFYPKTTEANNIIVGKVETSPLAPRGKVYLKPDPDKVEIFEDEDGRFHVWRFKLSIKEKLKEDGFSDAQIPDRIVFLVTLYTLDNPWEYDADEFDLWYDGQYLK
jgi:hypothetical protein